MRFVRSPRFGFSLIELLVVMGVLVIILSMALPAFTSVGQASSLTNSANVIADQLKLARQMAVAQNRNIYVRFFKIKGASGLKEEYRAIRLYNFDDEQQKMVAISPLKPLADSVIMISDNPQYSTILGTSNPSSGTEDLPGQTGVPYQEVEFGPAGSTSLNPLGAQSGADKWFVTIKGENDQAGTAAPAKNFITIMLDPVTGRLKTFQP